LEELWKSFHYPPESATPILIARIIAIIRNKLDQGVSAEEAMAPFLSFKNDKKNQEIGIIQKFLDEKFETRYVFYPLYIWNKSNKIIIKIIY